MLLRIAIALLFPLTAHAVFIDNSGPQDLLGHYLVDLYDASGNQRGTNANPIYINEPLDVTSAASSVTTQDVASTTVQQFSGQFSASGTPTAGSFALMALGSVQTAMIVITGTWTGSLLIEVSSDGGVTYQPRAMHVLGSPIFASAITSNVVGSINATAKTHVRVRATTAMNGTATVKFVGSANQSNVYVGNPVKIVDSTAVTAPPGLAIKAAGSPAASTDTAAVVNLRPYKYKNVTGNATTVVKTGSGSLHLVIIGNGATGGTATIYDNTSAAAPIIMALSAGTPAGGLLSGSGNPAGSGVGPIDAEFTTGLTVVTSGSANNNFTLVYQ